MLPDDPDQTAHLFYLLLLGLAILIGVFGSYRHRLGEATQHAAIWVLIFLVATLVFGFKDQLRSAFFNDEARAIGDNAIALSRANDGHFYVQAEVNGVPVMFLIDTGATSVSLSAADAKRIGFDLDRLNYSVRVSTANGIKMSAAVMLDNVSIRDFSEANVQALVSREGLDASLLGMSYLNRFTGFGVEGDTFYLRR